MKNRLEQLTDRIYDNGGRQLAEVDGPNHSRLLFFGVGNQTCIVQVFATDRGVDLYTLTPGITMEDLEIAVDRLAKT